MPRTTDDLKPHVITTRLNGDDVVLLDRLRARWGLSRSEALRHLLREAPAIAGPNALQKALQRKQKEG